MYDGSVNIDTKLSTAGFNKGTKSISASLGGVLKSVMAVAKAMAAAFVGGQIIGAIRSVIGSFDLMNSSIGGSLKTLSASLASLKSSFASLVLTAFAPMIPYIVAAVNWLTKLFTTLSQVIGALFGTSVAMAGVASETAGAGKEAKKAAGALAGFDQINVLNKQDAGAGGGAGGGGVLPSGVIPPELLSKVQAFKDKMLTFLQPVTDALGRLKDALIPLGETIWAGLKWAWDNILVPLGAWVVSDLLPAFLDLLAAAAGVLNEALKALAPLWQTFWDEFLQPLAEWTGGKIVEFLDWLIIKLGELAKWISENPEKFNIIVGLIAALAASLWLANAAMAIGAAATSLYTLVMSGFITTMLAAAIPFLTLAALIFAVIVLVALLVANWDTLSTTVKQIGFIIGFYVSQMADKIRTGFFTALDAVKSKFETIFTGIQSFIKGVINGIIGYINTMIQSVVNGLNGVVGGLNTVGSVLPGFRAIATVAAPQIPRLATGAVIPPNSEFLAMLGDQKSGKNIEAPADLIRQMVAEGMRGSGGGEMTVHMPVYLDGEKIYETVKKIDRRIGPSLIVGG